VATQAERRRSTRQALLVASAGLLVDDGLPGFTTAAVTQRANLSNGALFSHFPTRLDLLAATVEHILGGLREGYESAFTELLDSGAGIHEMLELLWSSMSDPGFAAVLGVYTQARTDPELYAAIHGIVVDHGAYVGRINRRISARFVDNDPGRAAVVAGLATIAILAMQGLVVAHMVGASASAKDEVIQAFTAILETARHRPPGAPDSMREH
jgi:AcrR family transcriptional regulator